MLPEINRFLLSAILALILSLLLAAPSLAGVVSVNLARASLISAWFAAVFYVCSSMSNAPWRHLGIAAFSIGVPAAVALIFVDRWIVRALKKIEKTPHIHTAMVIDSILNGEIEFHYEIENGEVPVENIRVVANSDLFALAENQLEQPRRLPPGGKLSIRGVLAVPIQAIPKPYLVVIVNVFYNSMGKELVSAYRFLISSNDLRPQVIYPEAVEDAEGPLNAAKIQQLLFERRFELSRGTIYFRAPELDNEGKPTQYRISNKDRQFEIDAVSRMVSFETRLPSGRVIRLKQGFSTTADHQHDIGVGWFEDQGANLVVDGVRQEELITKLIKKPRRPVRKKRKKGR
jgi:hypothetical protein